jgi:hypothetical protein
LPSAARAAARLNDRVSSDTFRPCLGDEADDDDAAALNQVGSSIVARRV